ncbi:MAG TPA: hypothetical protein VFS20_08660 [Longimicrobium sp.]|nr:hypothetical protein [Longimicrobium sp.]
MKASWMIVAIVLAACAPSPAPSGGDGEPQNPRAPVPAESTTAAGSGSSAPANEADTTRIARLEREARALARAEGCTAPQCRTAPVGSRPCGGPREYIVYCAATTDSAALFSKLAELARAEEDYNRRAGLASTCEFRMPPGTAMQGGRCVATQSNELGPQ